MMKRIFRTNKSKMSFEDAIDVFNDKDRIQYASNRNGEERFKVLGKALQAIIVVIYTTRDLIVRIISARRATKDERRTYLTKKLSNQDNDTK
ncbi:MAG: BrnT family toxin [Saprospirales bacterium]|nr:BrnT family toxin [Saprospirales bacterium]